MQQRFITVIFLAWGVYTLSFFILVGAVRLNPARVMLGPMAREQEVVELREQWGLNRPVYEQYFRQMGLLLHGNLAKSLFYRKSTTILILETLPKTFITALSCTLAALMLSLPLAILLSHPTKGRLHNTLLGAINLAQSLPGFVYLFIVLWGASRFFNITPLRSAYLYWIMTGLVGTIYPLAAISIYLMARLDEYQNSSVSHIKFAQAMGIPPWRIYLRLFKELLPSALTLSVSLLGATLTTIFFAEFLFGLNGFGGLVFRSALRGDTPVIMGGVLVASMLFLFAQFLSDGIQYLLDPRTRTQGRLEKGQ